MANPIENKLNTLSDLGSVKDGAIILGPSGTPMAMAEVLKAIDNTVLPRLVEFTVGDAWVSLNVSGRRLRACEAVSPNIEVAKGLLGTPLSATEADTLGAVGKILKTLTAVEGKLTLTRKKGPASSGQADAGVGIRSLAKIWDVDPDATPPSALEQFLAFMGEDCLASLEYDGESLVNGQGNAEVLSSLETAAAPLMAAVEQELATIQADHANPQILFLDSQLPDGTSIALIKLNGHKALTAISGDAAIAAASAWGRI